MSERIQTEIKCNDCGKPSTVPFKPTAGKPVYCKECLSKHRTRRPETSNRFENKTQRPENEKQAWSRRRENWR